MRVLAVVEQSEAGKRKQSGGCSFFLELLLALLWLAVAALGAYVWYQNGGTFGGVFSTSLAREAPFRLRSASQPAAADTAGGADSIGCHVALCWQGGVEPQVLHGQPLRVVPEPAGLVLHPPGAARHRLPHVSPVTEAGWLAVGVVEGLRAALLLCVLHATAGKAACCRRLPRASVCTSASASEYTTT